MIFVNGDPDLYFKGQVIRYFIASHDAIIVVKTGLRIAEIQAKL